MRLARFFLTGLTLTVVATLGVLPTTTAAFTDTTTLPVNTVRTGNLTATTLTPTTQTSATSTTLTWTPADTTGSALTPNYTLQRSTTPDGASPTTVYTGTDTTTTDTGGIPPERGTVPFTVISAGDTHTAAVAADGTVYTWGRNGQGQLGNGNNKNSSTPVRLGAELFDGQKITTIAVGFGHTAAVARNGTVYTWGAGGYGQLGNSSGSNQNTPVRLGAELFGGQKIIGVSAGFGHTVAVAADGTVYTWGYNGQGQLGNDSRTNASSGTPVRLGSEVFGGQKIVSVSAGAYHTAAIAADGTLYVWGNNSYGQLGNNSDGNWKTPVRLEPGVFGGKKVTSISAGSIHTAAVTEDGAVYTWGYNGSGRLGDNTVTLARTPVRLGTEAFGGQKVTRISAGGTYTVSVAENGAVYTWGSNGSGQLGREDVTESRIPVQVASELFGGQKITSIFAGSAHTAALAADGTAYTWGSNGTGQLGNGTTSQTANNAPFHIVITGDQACPTGSGVSADATCSLTPDTTYYYQISYAIGRWDAPPSAWMPVTTALSHLTPTIGEDSTATSLNVIWPAATSPSTYTLERSSTPDGADPVTVYIGSDSGALDAGGLPQQLRDVSFSATSAGSDHVIALTTDGAVYAWGANRYGQLGNDSPREQSTPVRLAADVFDGQKIVGVSAGGDHSAALAADGSVFMWGDGRNGQLGNNKQTVSSTPVRLGTEVFGGQKIVSISAGETHTAAVAADGSVYTWGLNLSGQLGNNSTTIRSLTPVRLGPEVFGGLKIVSVSAGAHHTAAVAADGSVYTWGFNGYGQLGNNGTTGRSLTPVRLGMEVFGGREIVSISAGGNHTAALAADGSAYMWGYNMYGQLGNNSTTNSSTPVRVEPELFGGQTIASISAGYNVTVAVAADGVAYAWGDNRYGQIGNNTTNNSSTPVRLEPELFGGQKVGSVTTGFNVTVAVAADGTIRVWGYNGSGQLGTGAAIGPSSPVPTQVTIQSVSCAPGAVTSSNGLCSLSPDTTYYYRVSYTTADGREGPASAWTPLRTPGS